MPSINDRDANRTMNERRKRLASMPRRAPSPAAVANEQRRLAARREQQRFKSAAAVALQHEADKRFGYKGKKSHEQGV